MNHDKERYKYKISVIMPVLDEEECLSDSVLNVLEGFTRLDIPGELIIVNDGSSDRTGTVAEAFKARYPIITMIHHPTPRGVGASFWEGVQQARGEIVVMLPGDGENDAGEVLRYLPLMEQVDIIVPFVTNTDVRRRFRRYLSFVYRTIINLTFDLSLAYTNGTVLYRKTVLEGISLKSSGFFYQTELLIKTIRKKCRFAEVPYTLHKRRRGHSKAITFHSLMNLMKSYFATVSDVYLPGR